MAGHITRLYLHQVCLEPDKPIGTIQRELRLKIFEGMSFNLYYFKMNMDPKENHPHYINAEEMQDATSQVIQFLGGKIDGTKVGSDGVFPTDNMTHLVMFRRAYKSKRLLPFIKAGKHIVWFGWIMECMFRM